MLKGTCTYNGLEQLAIRVTTNQTPSDTTHFIHDLAGNVIAEADGAAAVATTLREYIWHPEAEIAPTMHARAQVARPLAVVNAVNTAPVTWYVHVDHLNRPIRMTDAAKVSVWDAVWQPWGNVHAITGTAVLDARLPGQWFQLESGLHYNWNRSYNPTIGRYTQPDPLGFVDGPSVYGYAGGNPQSYVDPDGRVVWFVPIVIGAGAGLAIDYAISKAKEACGCDASGSPGSYAATGAAFGATGPFDTKPRTGVGGGGPSGNSTSVLSTAVMDAHQSGRISTTMRNVLRGGGRIIAGGSFGLGLALTGKDLFELYQCMRR